MVKFLTTEQNMAFRHFIMDTLANKYNQIIEVYENEIVYEGIQGEEIVEAIEVSFFPNDAKEENVENKIAGDIHQYIYENDLGMTKQLNIVKDVFLGEIRYKLVYIYAGDWVYCKDCQRKCKLGERVRCLHPLLNEE